MQVGDQLSRSVSFLASTGPLGDAFNKARSVSGTVSAAKDGADGTKGGGKSDFVKDIVHDATDGVKDAIPLTHVLRGGKDLVTGHPLKAALEEFRAVKQAASLATYAIPGVGEAKISVKGSELALKMGSHVARDAMRSVRSGVFNTCVSHSVNHMVGGSNTVSASA